MASVTYDGRSFQIDGRRVWIVSASIQYQRICREDWATRIHAAKQAGFNTIETPVFWGRVEPRPGSFDFKGDNDIRHFVQLVAEADMHVILRPGPYIGSGWDLGGLPAWLLDIDGIGLRKAGAPFLEAVSRYFTALAAQVKALQVSSTGQGGPILLIQSESNWTCGDSVQAATYLGELNRYLREAGFTAPKINTNNLWQGVEGEIDCWAGEGDMLATLRQLAHVEPDQPRLVADFGPKSRAVFGAAEQPPVDPAELQRRLAEILAGGGQYNLSPFACGTSFGFWAGQASTGEETFIAPTQDLCAALDEHGRPSAVHGMVRRISTFASRFGRVLSSLDPVYQPVVLDPTDPSGEGNPKGVGVTVCHATGSQGSIAFILSPESRKSSSVSLLLPNGLTMKVELGKQRAHWCLFDVNLSARATLDYCSLNAFAAVGDLFVCFGPSGSTGRLSINGTPLEVAVPKGRKPAIEMHEGVGVIVCSDELIDETFIADEAVFVGVRGVRPDGTPIEPNTARTYTRITLDGTSRTITASKDDGRSKTKSKMGEWEWCPAAEQLDGTSPRYAQIQGPGELSQLGAAYGYGWYRLEVRAQATKKMKVAAPRSGDRLHAYLDGELVGIIGSGPGASRTIELPIKKGEQTLVVLADNMGRVSGGSDMIAGKGLAGHLWEVAPLRTPKPKLVESPPIDLLGWNSPLFGVREGDVTHPMRLTWAFQHRKKAPIMLSLPPIPNRAVLVINDEPVRFIDANQSAEIVLDDPPFKRGNNIVQIAFQSDFMDEDAADAEVKALGQLLVERALLTECKVNLTAKSVWAFSKWEAPAESFFESASKADMSNASGPTWWRCDIEVPMDRAVWLELGGLTKGQVYLNGENVGRYFAATHTGDKVPPLHRMALPSAWLAEGPNDLLIFDEHGGNPSKAKVVIEDGPPV